MFFNLGLLTFTSVLGLLYPDTLLTLLFVLLILPDGCRTIKLSAFFPVSGSDLTGFDASVCSWFGLCFDFSPESLPIVLEGVDADVSGSRVAAFPEEEETKIQMKKCHLLKLMSNQIYK